MAPKNHAEDAIIAFLGTISKLSQSQDRYMVRDAGAIGPLVALMITGTGEVPARAASVLRDLAQHAANRTAILEAGGIAQLVKMLHVEKGATADQVTIATEAADALRCLCADYQPICEAIRESGGIKSLGSLLNRGHSSNAATVAAAALSQICQADPKSKELVRECGGVKALSKLINTGVASDASGVRKRGQDLANWCDGKACEAIATTMHQIVNVNGCPRIIRDEGCAAAARRHHPRITRQCLRHPHAPPSPSPLLTRAPPLPTLVSAARCRR